MAQWRVVPRFVLLAGVVLAAGACGATTVSFNPRTDEHMDTSSGTHEPMIESVSLACVGTARDRAVFVPCDGTAVPRDGALVAVWLHTAETQSPAEHWVALNDVELEPARHVTIDGATIPVFALADAFPEVRRGSQLPPGSYHVRVQIISITGKHTMHEHDVVIR